MRTNSAKAFRSLLDRYFSRFSDSVATTLRSNRCILSCKSRCNLPKVLREYHLVFMSLRLAFQVLEMPGMIGVQFLKNERRLPPEPRLEEALGCARGRV